MIIIDKFFVHTDGTIAFGNNIVQIILAIYACIKYDHDTLKFPMSDIFTFNVINIGINNKNTSIVTGTFRDNNHLFINDNSITVSEITHKQCIDIARQYVFPILNITDFHNKSIDFSKIDTTLFIHIRGGDIFGEFIHPAYVQPPLSFYKFIIKNNSYNQIVVVSSDKKNPCVEKLIDEYSAVYLSSTQMNDISMLLCAKHFACGFGTFGYTVAFLNKNLENIFIPDYCERFYNATIDQFKIIKLKINNYIGVGKWKATKQQLNLMITHDIANISFI